MGNHPQSHRVIEQHCQCHCVSYYLSGGNGSIPNEDGGEDEQDVLGDAD